MSVWVCRLRGDKVTLQRVVWLDVFFFVFVFFSSADSNMLDVA